MWSCSPLNFTMWDVPIFPTQDWVDSELFYRVTKIGIIWTAPFPLNICNRIIWGGAFPKHSGIQNHLFRYAVKMPACMIIFKILFESKTLLVRRHFESWKRQKISNLWRCISTFPAFQTFWGGSAWVVPQIWQKIERNGNFKQWCNVFLIISEA